MRAIVCGGRTLAPPGSTSEDYIWRKLSSLRPDSIVVGDNGDDYEDGTDAAAFRWAIAKGVHVAHCPALWRANAKAAGPLRNGFMATLNVDTCIAFPGGRGTDDMIGKARALGLNVIEVRFDEEG